ncbi:hypothetical protein ACFOWM_06815 [Ferruginibacter yonginensis]|uniref:Uncharacterized protein n=1 Tax=Ferruginibacter yonginensis TaxID=1310416 RepID=A0ABV8QQM3_9BACT
MKIVSGIAVSIILVATSCNNNDDAPTAASYKNTATPATIVPAANNTSSNPVLNVPAANMPSAVVAPTTTTAMPAPVNNTAAPTTGTAKAGINPAHGQPGHRCDLPVGASLSSAPPAPTTQPTAAMTTPTQIKAPTTVATPAKAGTNPAHGQPGHRCDLPVGASLSSAPAPAAATPAASMTTPTQIQPPLPISNNGSSAKLNPAHGQPGHDCKVAVGQPLP